MTMTKRELIEALEALDADDRSEVLFYTESDGLATIDKVITVDSYIKLC
jgi:hypothetical protein